MKKILLGVVIAISLLIAMFFGYLSILKASNKPIAFKVPTNSMKPTIMKGDRIGIDRLAYGFNTPKRYDVVVLKTPSDEKKRLVRRIMGLPSETIEIKNGSVIINGQVIRSEFYYYNRDEYAKEGHQFKIPQDSYYVLGDNSMDSLDSRYFGSVPSKNIEGKVFIQMKSKNSKTIQEKPNIAENYFVQGLDYFQKRDPDQAITYCTKAIEINPDKVAYYYHIRGLSYLDKGNYDQAIVDCTKAIEIDPDKVGDYYYARGLAYSKKQIYDLAIKDFDNAIKINPKYWLAFSDRGLAYQLNGNIDQAFSDYNKAIELNPDSENIYYYRGMAYANNKNYDQAISDFNKAIELNSRYALAYAHRGDAYYSKGDYNLAAADYTKAIEAKPSFTEAYVNRAGIYCWGKDYDKAWEDVHAAEALGYKFDIEFIDKLKKASGREK